MFPDENDELRPREDDGVGGEDPLQVVLDNVFLGEEYYGQQDHDAHLDQILGAEKVSLDRHGKLQADFHQSLTELANDMHQIPKYVANLI